jgi:hypothetical protein
MVAAVAASQAGAGDVVYVERRGEDYRWERLAPGAAPVLTPQQPGAALPDAWIFYSGPWHAAEAGDPCQFAEDLLAEMESMTGGADRCRWPLDQPYPHQH